MNKRNIINNQIRNIETCSQNNLEKLSGLEFEKGMIKLKVLSRGALLMAGNYEHKEQLTQWGFAKFIFQKREK